MNSMGMSPAQRSGQNMVLLSEQNSKYMELVSAKRALKKHLLSPRDLLTFRVKSGLCLYTRYKYVIPFSCFIGHVSDQNY